MRPLLSVAQEPRIPSQEFLPLSIVPARDRPRPAGVLPFRLRGQSVAPEVLGPGPDAHPLCVLPIHGLITLRKALPAAAPVAESGGFVPGHRDLGPVRVGAVALGVLVTEGRVLGEELLELANG